jgi:predicted alpha/beta-fold hydrolase
MSQNHFHPPLQPFAPHRAVQAANIQTILSRYLPRGIALQALEHPVLLDGGEDQTGWDPGQPVRLHGYFTPGRRLFGSRGLVLVLHGWEGCSHSVYNLVTTDSLIRAGYDVFRLNVRDHGPGLHLDPYALNRGFFMGTLLDEIATAVQQIAEMAGDKPFYIVGASMGGNLALRLAIRHTRQPLPNLKKVIAINPAINPMRTVHALDAQPAYLRYFRTRWLRSLQAKQQLFAQCYQFDNLAKIPKIHQMTEWIIEHYGHHYGAFTSAADYYRSYSVLGDAFKDLAVSTTIITAANDHVVPVVDFFDLARHPLLDVQIHATGGHVGYMDLFPLRHTLPRLMLAALHAEDRVRAHIEP